MQQKRFIAKPERIPQGTKDPVEKALRALVADNAITLEDKLEIVELIGIRNAIGHDLHDLLADIGSDHFCREWIEAPKPYKYDAVARARHFPKLVGDLNYVTTLKMNALLFESAERTLLSEIQRLERRIRRLAKARSAEIKIVNSELSLEGTALVNDFHPLGSYSKYDNGRLTEFGVEICHRAHYDEHSTH